jgi:prophage DNA circulation protein
MPTAYWRDEYESLPAAIGGVPFRMERAQTSVGRRNAIQKFPNTPAIREHDQGEETDAFGVNGYLVGRDYHIQKRNLEAVFKQAGPKLLVHPYRGRMLVLIEGVLEITEDKKRGGYCDISFKCHLYRESTERLEFTTPADAAEIAAAGARTAATASMAEQFALDDESRLDAFMERVEAFQTLVTDSVGLALSVTSEVSSTIVGITGELIGDVASLASVPMEMLQLIGNATRAMINAPFNVGDSILDNLDALSDGEKILAMLGIAQRLTDSDSGLEPLTPGALAAEPSDEDTVSTIDMRNAQALTAMVRTEAAACIVEAILNTDPESVTQAQEVLAGLERLICGVDGYDPDALFRAVDDVTFAALSDLRATARTYVNVKSVTLPEILTYEVPGDTCALLLAQKLLGDASRWEEIVDRNDLADPLFISAGTVIEYLEAT